MRSSYHKWTSSELQYIKDNHVLLSDDELATDLARISGSTGITAPMIRRQRRKLDLKKNRGRKPKNRNVVEQNRINLDLRTQVSS